MTKILYRVPGAAVPGTFEYTISREYLNELLNTWRIIERTVDYTSSVETIKLEVWYGESRMVGNTHTVVIHHG